MLCLITLPGCGDGRTGPKPVKITGVVKFNGKPLDNGNVMFSPADPKTGHMAQGPIDKNGNFTLSTYDTGDGVIAGTYTVSVTSTKPGTEKLAKDKGTGIGGTSAIPDKFADPKKSGLQQTIAAGDSGKVITLELKE